MICPIALLVFYAQPLAIQLPSRIEPSDGSRREPAWSFSKLTQTRPDFKRVREAVLKQFGELPEDIPVAQSYGDDAYDTYTRTKSQAEAFRALYLCVARNETEGPVKFEKLWDVLPKDDYEVARLHFLWGADVARNKVRPMGDRLLAINGHDAEVLSVMAGLRSLIWPDRDFAKATAYAAELLKIKPCRLSTYRYGQVLRYKHRESKAPKDASEAIRYLQKYLADYPHTKNSIMVVRAKQWLAELKKA